MAGGGVIVLADVSSRRDLAVSTRFRICCVVRLMLRSVRYWAARFDMLMSSVIIILSVFCPLGVGSAVENIFPPLRALRGDRELINVGEVRPVERDFNTLMLILVLIGFGFTIA
jgi:hypothetical protein